MESLLSLFRKQPPAEPVWFFVVDEHDVEVRDAHHLASLLAAPELKNASLVLLQRRRAVKRRRSEKQRYEALGLDLPDYETVGTVDASLYPELAQVLYTEDDGDEGVLAVEYRGPASKEKVELRAPDGKVFIEPRSYCIKRGRALKLFPEFYASGQRPTSVEWMPTSELEDS